MVKSVYSRAVARPMRWIGISGTWRTTDENVEDRVRCKVREILARGHGIVAGGATGVDYFATDEALKIVPDASKVKVVLPSTLEEYIGHLKAWGAGHKTGDPPLPKAEMDKLIKQMRDVQAANPAAIVEGPPVPALDIRQNDYYARDTVVAALSCELVAFKVNDSKGTRDTIRKAGAAGKAVTIFSFTQEVDKAFGRIIPKAQVVSKKTAPKKTAPKKRKPTL